MKVSRAFWKVNKSLLREEAWLKHLLRKKWLPDKRSGRGLKTCGCRAV
jgi:hypothetical protein